MARRLARYLRPGTLQLAALPPLSLYIHMPWCVRKCPYCDFNSHEARGERAAKQRYVDALRRRPRSALPLIWGRKVHTVFIGGGTPSLFSAAAIDRLLADIRARLPLAPDCEITLEANPGHVRAREIPRLPRRRRQPAVARRPELRRRAPAALGRVHDAAQARARGRGSARRSSTTSTST